MVHLDKKAITWLFKKELYSSAFTQHNVLLHKCVLCSDCFLLSELIINLWIFAAFDSGYYEFGMSDSLFLYHRHHEFKLLAKVHVNITWLITLFNYCTLFYLPYVLLCSSQPLSCSLPILAQAHRKHPCNSKYNPDLCLVQCTMTYSTPLGKQCTWVIFQLCVQVTKIMTMYV